MGEEALQENEDEPRAPPRLEALRAAARRLAEEDPEARAAALGMRLVRLTAAPVELWAALGREADYIVVPGTFCSCPHFVYRVAPGETTRPCYHLAAVELARQTGRFHDLAGRASREDVEAVILEAITVGRSATLRRLIHGGCERGNI